MNTLEHKITRYKIASHSCRITRERSESARERRTALYKQSSSNVEEDGFVVHYLVSWQRPVPQAKASLWVQSSMIWAVVSLLWSVVSHLSSVVSQLSSVFDWL